jgi:beta-lactamase superfamily II metal-dependent hydrolase
MLARFKVETVYSSGHRNNSFTFATFEGQAVARLQHLAAGDSFENDGVRFEVLWPAAGEMRTNLNDLSLVLRMAG